VIFSAARAGALEGISPQNRRPQASGLAHVLDTVLKHQLGGRRHRCPRAPPEPHFADQTVA